MLQVPTEMDTSRSASRMRPTKATGPHTNLTPKAQGSHKRHNGLREATKIEPG